MIENSVVNTILMRVIHYAAFVCNLRVASHT